MALLQDKVAIVTGAGGGLGRQHALALAAEGAAVVVNDVGVARDGSAASEVGAAERVVAEIEAGGGRAVASVDSVATVAGGEAILATALDAFGKVDILVNNAGILRDRTLVKLEEPDWDAVIAVHLKGAYCVTRPVFCHLRERAEGGVIVNTSSTSGMFGNFGQTNYGAAKAGLYGFTRSLALEGRRHGIRAWALVPLATTRMSEDLPPMQDEAVRQRFDPAQVSPVVVYMVSDLSGERTGRVLFAGAGRIAEIRVTLEQGVRLREGYSARDLAAAADGLFGPDDDFALFEG